MSELPIVEFADRNDRAAVENGTALRPKFDADGLIPAVATDATTGDILMLAYMNAESLRMTIELGEAVYYSRSRQELWHKGKTSGHIQKVEEIRLDCDQDAVWIKVQQIGGAACHTGYRSCFFRRVDAVPGETAKLVLTEHDKAFDPAIVYGKH